MDPIRPGGWNYNVTTGPPLDWDTSKEAAKYFRVVKWISTIVENQYSPNDKDPAEPVPTPVSSRALILPLFFEIFGEDREDEPMRSPAAPGAGWGIESSPTSKRVAVWSGVKKFKAKCNLIDSRPIIYPSDRQRGGIAGGANQGEASGGHGGRGGRGGGRGGGYGGYVNRGGYSGEFGGGSGRGRGGIHQGGVL